MKTHYFTYLCAAQLQPQKEDAANQLRWLTIMDTFWGKKSLELRYTINQNQ